MCQAGDLVAGRWFSRRRVLHRETTAPCQSDPIDSTKPPINTLHIHIYKISARWFITRAVISTKSDHTAVADVEQYNETICAVSQSISRDNL